MTPTTRTHAKYLTLVVRARDLNQIRGWRIPLRSEGGDNFHLKHPVVCTRLCPKSPSSSEAYLMAFAILPPLLRVPGRSNADEGLESRDEKTASTKEGHKQQVLATPAGALVDLAVSARGFSLSLFALLWGVEGRQSLPRALLSSPIRHVDRMGSAGLGT